MGRPNHNNTVTMINNTITICNSITIIHHSNTITMTNNTITIIDNTITMCNSITVILVLLFSHCLKNIFWLVSQAKILPSTFFSAVVFSFF